MVCGVDDPIEGEEEDKERETYEECVTRNKRLDKAPDMPSKEEYIEHQKTHIPYKPWCRYRVQGKAKNTPHHRSQHKRNLPMFSMDYMYMTGHSRNNGEHTYPTLVIKERSTGGIWALSGIQKGVQSKHLITRVAKIINALGAPQVIIKSDQEPATINIQQNIRKTRWAEIEQIAQGSRDQREQENGGKTILENSPVGESQSNGQVERAIQEIQGQIKTIKHS